MAKIGLEIHGYLDTNEKLFCKCKSIHGMKFAKPNTNICPICTGQPGAKPLLPNSTAIKKIIEIALILNCKINETLVWQRKHYDWPDLPKGYQNTISGTHAIPVGTNGKFENIQIREVHVEEDPAAWNPETGEIDYNRSGIPLVEIVTEPDFKNSDEVIEWLRQLIPTLNYIKAINKSSGIKADVNVSLPELKGERVEMKNINSLKNIKDAIEAEIKRQQKPGELPKFQETRMFNPEKQTTIRMRSKEQAQDYRFISDPDLPVIKIEKIRINKLKDSLPETPKVKLKKLIKKHKIEKKHAEVLTKKLDIAEFFEKVIKEISSKIAIPWTIIELPRVLNYNKKELSDEDIEIKVEHFIELLKLVEEKIITELKAKEILNMFIPKSFSPIKEAKKHLKISEKSEIEKIVEQVIKENTNAVNDYKSGKKEAINFLMGQVMRLSNKRADYNIAKELLEKMLKN
ncbi:MAG: Asp-tRNA(Asn)/Glu-tRNA(Gln) amidotransferase subunit GatB [Nanoarchaeota archaeon]